MRYVALLQTNDGYERYGDRIEYIEAPDLDAACKVAEYRAKQASGWNDTTEVVAVFLATAGRAYGVEEGE